MVFVPGFRPTGGADPWAHRKGEPRPLTLLWAVYLMSSALLTLFAVRSLTVPSTEQFVYGCRALLAMLLAGICLLWPMTRLSQVFPSNPDRSLLADLGAILVPAQAVVWPMPILTHWSIELTLALSVLGAAWAVATAGMLRVAYSLGAGRCGRTGAMLLWVLALSLGPAGAALGPGVLPGVTPRDAAWLNPLTAVFRATSAPSGLPPVMTPFEWVCVLLPCGAGALLWSIGRLSRPRVR